MGEYIYIDGVEFYTRQSIGLTKVEIEEREKLELDRKRNPAFKFPVKTVIRKRRDGYYMFCNDTVHNYSEFERTGKIP
jgi:hypothetical protein